SPWLRPHAAGSLAADRAETPGRPVFGLFANVSEFTLARFRVPRDHPFRRLYPDPVFWRGYVVRSGMFDDTSTATRRPLGYLTPASQLPDARRPDVGFRCARS